MKHIFFTLCLILFSSFSYADDKPLESIYQNKFKILNLSTGEVTLKTFYTLYRDGPYNVFKAADDFSYILVGDGLYFEYWKKTDNIWLPMTNKYDAMISPQKIADNVYGYVFDETDKNCVYKVRYWKTKAEYFGDTVKLTDGIDICRDIKIAGTVYTAVTGKGNKVRNVNKSTVEKVFGNKQVVISEEYNYLVIGEPSYIKLSKP